jgi:hypothetical protein
MAEQDGFVRAPRKTQRPEIDQPPRSHFTDPKELEYYDWICERHASMSGRTYAPGDPIEVGQHYGPLMITPEWAWHLHQLGGLFRKGGLQPGTYSHADREWVDQVVGWDAHANHVFPGHIDDALSAGVRIDAIIALREGREEDLTEDEQLLTRYIRQVLTGTVDDETWDRMFARLGHRGIVEYTTFILMFNMILRSFQAYKVPAPSDEEIEQHIRELKDGTRQPVAGFEQRLR